MHKIGNYKVVRNKIVHRMIQTVYDPKDFCLIIDGRTKSLLKRGTRDFILRFLPNYAIRNTIPLVLIDFSEMPELSAHDVCTIANYLDRASNEQVTEDILQIPLDELRYHVAELAKFGF